MAYIGGGPLGAVVRQQRLWLDRVATDIFLDTPAWFLWLQTATHFSYALRSPSYYSLTLRKEKRRGGWYWYAYLKTEAKLHNAYAGRSESLSATRLDAVGQILWAKTRRQAALAHEKKKVAPS
ncbi:MAG: hypothetical protein R3C14_43705 [Caldilineaceae bacterium]